MVSIDQQRAMASRGLKPAHVLAQHRPCGDRLKYIGGCRCAECRRANTEYEKARAIARKAGDWNGNVSAERARKHLHQLSLRGIGRRTVQAATDIADTILVSIMNGSKIQIRARTERLILAVTEDCRADHALVSADDSWRLIRELLEAGFTRARIAKELGNKTPNLQLSKAQVTVRHAAMIERIHARLIQSDEALVSASATWALIRDLRYEGFLDPQIARAIGMDDGVLKIASGKITRDLASRVEAAYRTEDDSMSGKPITDAEKQAILQASILNIGRLIPEGMQVTFTRDPGCASMLEMTYPSGMTTHALFRNYAPIYHVLEVPVEQWFEAKGEPL